MVNRFLQGTLILTIAALWSKPSAASTGFCCPVYSAVKGLGSTKWRSRFISYHCNCPVPGFRLQFQF